MIRKLDRLEESNKHLNKKRLHAYGCCTYELTIAPFSNLTPRNPPGWYFRRYVESMIRVAKQWECEIREETKEYYLAIWLFSPRCMKSQVVAAVGEGVKYYENLFRDRECGGRFPDSVANLQKEHPWACMWDHEPFWKDADELNQPDINFLRNHFAMEEKD
ncbi:MAG: hypothetical protein U1F77_08275 [Kiritimatiellia bacterium]